MNQDLTNSLQEPNVLDPTGAVPMMGVAPGLPAPTPAPAPAPTLAPMEGPPVPPGTLVSPPPAASPAAPPATTVKPMGDDPVREFQQSTADAEQKRAEADKLQAAASEAEAQRLEKQAHQERERIQERDDHEAALNHTRDRLTAIADQADSDVANHKFTSLMSTLPTGNKIAVYIGGILSGLGGAEKPFAILDAAVDRHFAQQKAELASKESLAQLKHDGVKDFHQYMRDQRLYWDQREKATRDAIAGEMEAEALRTKNPLAIKRAEVASAEFRQKAAEKLGEVQKTYAETQYSNARAKLTEAKARAARGGGTGENGKLQQLTEALTKSGGELTPEVAAVADRLRIKRTDLTAMASQFKGERRADLQERGEVAKRGAEWAKENNYYDISKKASELDRLGRVLQGEKVNGLDRAFVLQEAERAAKGGTATIGGVNIDLAHMAGGVDKLNQIVAKWHDGNFSDAQSQALLQSIQNQAQSARGEVDNLHDSFQQTFRQDPRLATNPALVNETNRLADSMFSRHGYSRKPKTESKPEARAEAKTGNVDPKLALAQQALDDPEATADDKMQARRVLFAAKKAK